MSAEAATASENAGPSVAMLLVGIDLEVSAPATERPPVVTPAADVVAARCAQQ